MDASRFLEENGEGGEWDSSGEFALANRRRSLPRLCLGNNGKWIHAFTDHALGIGADRFEIEDRGEYIDETIGLSLRYNGTKPMLRDLRNSVADFLKVPPIYDSLAFALAQVRDSGLRLGSWRFGLTEAVFVAHCKEGCLVLDLLTGDHSFMALETSCWAFSLSLWKERPLFTYSLFGHPEIREISKLPPNGPLVITVKQDDPE